MSSKIAIETQLKNENLLHTRIVLLGKTGSGKSATGNTILGINRFTSKFSFCSVTQQSEMHQAVVSERMVSVVDTPGIFDTKLSADELSLEIGRSIYMSSPGPHAFLYVLRFDRFTEKDVEAVKQAEEIFGEGMRKNTIILFTYSDQVDVDNVDILINENSDLRMLVGEVTGDYHMFNNKKTSNRQQVTELLEKIDRMVEQNGRSYYSSKMYEDAARFSFDKFLNKYRTYLMKAGGIAAGGGVASGAFIGAVVGGCVGGPVGAGIGFGIGAAAGLGTGVVGTGIITGEKLAKTIKQTQKHSERVNAARDINNATHIEFEDSQEDDPLVESSGRPRNRFKLKPC